MPYSREAVAKRLCVIRKDRGMEQGALADASGVSRDSITRYETGMNGMNFESAIKIAEALDISLDELACREDYVCKA